MSSLENKYLIVVVVLAAVNLIAFATMYLDKARSRKTGAERIPEGLLFFAAAAFGSIGILGGMFAFRHKTAKWYFAVGIPLLIVQNSATLYLAYFYLLRKI